VAEQAVAVSASQLLKHVLQMGIVAGAEMPTSEELQAERMR
jgi:hypothetical protein